MKLLCPSKTFLVGEYAVLHGGPAIVIVHEPNFCLSNEKLNPASSRASFHPNSAAGTYIRQQAIDVAEFEFLDPHHGKGGFGASSAEFIFAYCLKSKCTLPFSAEQAFSARSAYFATLEELQAPKGSGVDIVCQTQTPGIYYIHPARAILEHLPWPFPEFILELRHTQCKTITHDHLAELPQIDPNPLSQLVEAMRIAILNKQQGDVTRLITHYHQALLQQNLVHSNTINSIDNIAKMPEFISAKGCGALGSDVILSFCKKQPNDPSEAWVNVK